MRSKVKVMLTAFFESRGVIHHEYAPQGQTINKEYYRDVPRRLRDAVRRKKQDLWTLGNWRLHHDIAPAHSSQLFQTFGQKNRLLCFDRLLTPVIWPLRLLAVPHSQEAIERNAISDKRRHYGSNDSRAKIHSERGFFGMLPKMATPLVEVCGVPRELI